MAMAKPILSLLAHLHAALLFLPAANPAAAMYYYNVVRYGARPDASADAAGAFHRAWADACRSTRPATVHVPPGVYLVSTATFSGPCHGHVAVTFAIAGTLVAPSGLGGRGSSGRWITFENLDGLVVSGGTLDGHFTGLTVRPQPRCVHHGKAILLTWLVAVVFAWPLQSLTIANSRDVVVAGVRSVDSELFHVVVLQCVGVTVRGVMVEAPADSPNTDGIHVHRSSHVAVYDARISTGDDCVSIGPGNSHLWIERVACGPGHGIRYYALGKQEGMAVEAVENVTVKTTWFTGTTNGLRIKTWGGTKRGFVRGVTFADATMAAVDNPIIIDQRYCPGGGAACAGKSAASSSIRISDVRYVGIRGTSATPVAVTFDCSRSNPCSGIHLQDVALTYYHGRPAAARGARSASCCRRAASDHQRHDSRFNQMHPASYRASPYQAKQAAAGTVRKAAAFFVWIGLKRWDAKICSPNGPINQTEGATCFLSHLGGVERAKPENDYKTRARAPGLPLGPSRVAWALHYSPSLARPNQSAIKTLMGRWACETNDSAAGHRQALLPEPAGKHARARVAAELPLILFRRYCPIPSHSLRFGPTAPRGIGASHATLTAHMAHQPPRRPALAVVDSAAQLPTLKIRRIARKTLVKEEEEQPNPSPLLGNGGGMEKEPAAAVARNRKVVLRGYIDRAPREDDMELVDGGDVALRVPGDAGGGHAVLVRNLYLSCDPYMRGRMRDFQGSYIPPFKPGSHGVTAPSGIHNLYTLISKRVEMKGFIQSDYAHLFPQFVDDITKHYRDGKIVYVEDMSVGLESGPAAFAASASNRDQEFKKGSTQVRVETEPSTSSLPEDDPGSYSAASASAQQSSASTQPRRGCRWMENLF
ncbi:hypothetical protein HU200_067134 [Digitaria exilis]|uniref:Oxidoreductase N-terminal domain-containing protein n=1 Tax=Digitaria exilis TaxID=1010633 RepID=A0A835A0P1_9POAL|nr:hypothetical protein HU200_067134 [Digitaria exilis]